MIFRGILLCVIKTLTLVGALHVSDTLVDDEQLVERNGRLLPKLQQLVETDFFRYFKADLGKPCPFWNENAKCNNKQCAVSRLDRKQEELDQMWRDQNLGAVAYLKKQSPFPSHCESSDMDFCVLEDDNNNSGSYIDLLDNPERFTGYSGESAWKIWKSIYEQNCFKFIYGEDSATMTAPLPANPSQLCLEKRTFYRVISGLHSSISAHVCWDHLDKETGAWAPNLECYLTRFANHADRRENLYFLYTVMLQAIASVNNYVDIETFCTGNTTDSAKTKSLFAQIIQIANGSYIGTDSMFVNDQKLKQEFRQQFRNVSRIMDCVGCEKCRLWGKIQVTGMGTAFKILFSLDPNLHSLNSQLNVSPVATKRFRRTEIVALFNAFARFAETIEMFENFEAMIKQQQASSPDWVTGLIVAGTATLLTCVCMFGRRAGAITE